MADWTAFGAVAGLVLVLVLGLARVTTAALTGGSEARSRRRAASGRAASSRSDAGSSAGREAKPPGTTSSAGGRAQHERSHRRPADGGAAAESAHDATREELRGGQVDGAGVTRRRSEENVDRSLDDESVRGSVGEETVDGSSGEETADEIDRSERRDRVRLPSVSTPALLGNVVVTHGALAAVIAGAAAMTDVPAAALGVTEAAWSTGGPALLGGLGLGLALALSNGAAAANLDRLGIEHSDALRAALAPSSRTGWAVLLAVILPLVAVFEELLFRGVLVGAAAAATGVSQWVFVVPASVAFAAGHGLQGRGGVLVTGVLGGVLAVAFVLTDSLLVVVVAHYVVNAAEFLLHEWLEVDVHGRLAV